MDVLYSPAKINAFLKVVGKTPDGYHLLESLMIKLQLADEMHVDLKPHANLDVDIRFQGPDANDIDPKKNTIIDTLVVFSELFECGFSGQISIHKRIPTQAGLGGGSANAGILLSYLQKITDQAISPSIYETIGAKLGSDVPFFLGNDDAQWMIGKGSERVLGGEAVEASVVLVQPSFRCSTPHIYRDLNWQAADPSDAHFKRSVPRQFEELVSLCHIGNDLERPVAESHPELDRIKQLLINQGAGVAQMTGSGSVIFGLFDSRTRAQAATLALKNKWNVILTWTGTEK